MKRFLRKIFRIEFTIENIHEGVVHKIRYVPWDKIFTQYPHDVSHIRLHKREEMHVTWGKASPQIQEPSSFHTIWATWRKIAFEVHFSNDTDEYEFDYFCKPWLYQVSFELQNFALQSNQCIISIFPQVRVYQTISSDTYKQVLIFGKTIWKKYLLTNYVEEWSLECLTIDIGG